MTNKSIIAQDLKDAFKLLKGVKRVTKELLQEVKEMESVLSPYDAGQEVLVFWAGRERTGTIVDGLVNYNHAFKFTVENCEPACIIRFMQEEGEYYRDGQTLYLGTHAVIPHREIRKIL